MTAKKDKKKKEETVVLNLRGFPKELHEEVKRFAEVDMRSIKSIVILALREYMEIRYEESSNKQFQREALNRKLHTRGK
jgi:hypothetical protein